MDSSKSTIQITNKLRKTLKEIGKKGESYEDIIWKLLESQKEVKARK